MPPHSHRHAAYAHGFARVAACVPALHIADPAANAAAVLDLARRGHADGAALAVFPELCLTGYAIDDLLMQDAVLDAVEAAMATLAAETADLMPVLVVGLPLARDGRLYNAAAVLHRGRILGVVPKSYLPSYREFHEARHFAPGAGVTGRQATVAGQTVPFGTDLLFEAADLTGFVLGVEICEDVWMPAPPSGFAAMAGATVLANLSASPALIGRAAHRTATCQAQSARCLAAYVYAAAGDGESGTDLAWDGQGMVFEAGRELAQSARFATDPHVLAADVDLDLLRQERQRMGSFGDAARAEARPYRRVTFRLAPPMRDIGLRRDVPRFPFVPADPARLAQDCYEGFNIQVSALAQRLRRSGAGRLVIGVSGGLDSTHALLVCARAMDRLGRPRADILGYTMPGFGTGGASRALAHALMAGLGVAAHEIDITAQAQAMLAAIGHPAAAGAPVHDATYENVQAGLRTDILFRLANRHDGLVVGTGDLSELALGWCTYGVGDQMAHYNVNAGAPKTLIQHLVRWAAAPGPANPGLVGPGLADTLRDVLAAGISPELIPGGGQLSEDAVGPYELQDFNLFHVVRHGFRPDKVAFLAHHAWGDAARGGWPDTHPADRRRAYGDAEIARWLAVFLRRFFGTSQFKRSAMPNGPKMLGGGALSPRGDWRAPSDGNARAWLAALGDA